MRFFDISGSECPSVTEAEFRQIAHGRWPINPAVGRTEIPYTFDIQNISPKELSKFIQKGGGQVQISPINAKTQSMIEFWLMEWKSACGDKFSFVKQSSPLPPDAPLITIFFCTGYSEAEGTTRTFRDPIGYIEKAFVCIPPDVANSNIKQISYYTAIHEIGHALGLSTHPHEIPTLVEKLKQTPEGALCSVMAYPWEIQAAPTTLWPINLGPIDKEICTRIYNNPQPYEPQNVVSLKAMQKKLEAAQKAMQQELEAAQKSFNELEDKLNEREAKRKEIVLLWQSGIAYGVARGLTKGFLSRLQISPANRELIGQSMSVTLLSYFKFSTGLSEASATLMIINWHAAQKNSFTAQAVSIMTQLWFLKTIFQNIYTQQFDIDSLFTIGTFFCAQYAGERFSFNVGALLGDAAGYLTDYVRPSVAKTSKNIYSAVSNVCGFFYEKANAALGNAFAKETGKSQLHQTP